ncbi:MAG TPA: von Willebrand factor type A domain-containing protein [Flavobacteriaceae bacterium]|nr:von Willebrand factor type A domain-containing protein [Flavobacteriaceae bacterium]
MKTFFTFLAISCLGFSLTAQEIKITGTVTNAETGIALAGVNIVEKGTSNGTQTNFDGNYKITAQIGNILSFNYIGYQEVKIKVTPDQKIIDVKMKTASPELDQVVVTAYGISQGYARRNYRPLPPITETESYDRIEENSFQSVATSPLSTFSIDVDKASYSNIRRMINHGQKIPKDAVKVEEMINYFHYDYPDPNGKHPFSITTEIAESPWNAHTKLVRIGLKGKKVSVENAPASNLVFLIDVSGSMQPPNRLPLLQSAFKVLVEQLREKDQVSIVVYAGSAGLVLEPTSGANKEKIYKAIDNLRAGGSTAGGAGINLAYKIAEENFIEGGNNRVVLATDGDFNVGMSSNRSMEELITEKRESGVFLTCLGVGMGNYRDSKIETLADKGNGNHYYIDTMQEAQRVLGTEFFGTIYTIAKDVKIQVEFNPEKVQAYRLIGYENRMLEDEDFKNDKKDAGELGSGHNVTAFYEIIPTGVESKYMKDIPDLKYTQTKSTGNSEEILTVKFRYKDPEGEKSKLIVKTVRDSNKPIEKASADFKFAAAVALFGMQLRDSEFISTDDTSDVIALAEAGRGEDEAGYRSEFIRLVGIHN